ncbi:hypothetical protein BMS3Bbin01_03009 [bacterium BMS3Bbin01]|nr:hypothetical protein BMS3Bbin01_03009 [bacterium BMS3Bbin01]
MRDPSVHHRPDGNHPRDGDRCSQDRRSVPRVPRVPRRSSDRWTQCPLRPVVPQRRSTRSRIREARQPVGGHIGSGAPPRAEGGSQLQVGDACRTFSRADKTYPSCAGRRKSHCLDSASSARASGNARRDRPRGSPPTPDGTRVRTLCEDPSDRCATPPARCLPVSRSRRHRLLRRQGQEPENESPQLFLWRSSPDRDDDAAGTRQDRASCLRDRTRGRDHRTPADPRPPASPQSPLEAAKVITLGQTDQGSLSSPVTRADPTRGWSGLPWPLPKPAKCRTRDDRHLGGPADSALHRPAGQT